MEGVEFTASVSKPGKHGDGHRGLALGVMAADPTIICWFFVGVVSVRACVYRFSIMCGPCPVQAAGTHCREIQKRELWGPAEVMLRPNMRMIL